MKARDFKRKTLVETAAAASFGAVAGAIIGTVTVAPVVFGKGVETVKRFAEEQRRKHDEGMPPHRREKLSLTS